MPNDYSYRDPTLSLWQAAVAEVQRQRTSVQNRTSPAARLSLAVPQLPAQADLMSPAHAVAQSLTTGQPLPQPAASGQRSPAASFNLDGTVAVIGDCAAVAAKFLWAEVTGNKQDSLQYQNELKFSECDALGWGDCLAVYLRFKLSCGTLPYRPNQDIVKPLPDNATVGIIGDWGTGEPAAINLLQQVATFKPDILLHLGDVYYAGTQNEENDNFLAVCHQILGSQVPLYSLCGNHDMYSGGDGYYWLIDQIGQGASYFCLQNDHWQFLAMDTGHNDHNLFTVATNMTGLVSIPGWSEADWHVDKIKQGGGRRTAVFSHHQLFSSFGSVGTVGGQQYAYNPNLYDDFQGVLPKIDIWFWGHEHTLALYDPYMSCVRGRCVGASAVPVFTNQQNYTAAAGLQTSQGLPLPSWNPSAILGSNGTDYNNCFAIMKLNGAAAATVNYYQVPLLGAYSALPFVDTI